jgi:hypothetical protein
MPISAWRDDASLNRPTRATRVTRAGLTAIALLPPALGHAGSTPVPAGPQFQVNVATTGSQRMARVAESVVGEFVIVWQSDVSSGNDGSGTSIQGRRYSAPGGLTAEIQINSYTTGAQQIPAVAPTFPAGGFVVAWESIGSVGIDSSAGSIQARRFSSAGTPAGAQFQVNSWTSGHQTMPSVAGGWNGDFVVAWRNDASTGSDPAGYSVRAQRYANYGVPEGGEFQANSFTTGIQTYPGVAADQGGNFVIVWESQGSYGGDVSGSSVQGQRYSVAGAALGGQFQINSWTTGHQTRPMPAMKLAGDFVVAWDSAYSAGSDNSNYSVQGQRFTSAGSAHGPQFQVNSLTTNVQRASSIAVDYDGEFVAVWMSSVSAGDDNGSLSIQGQRYSAGGSPLGAQFQVNTYTTGNQALPSVAASLLGDFLVVWHSDGSPELDSSAESIQARHFRVTGDLRGRVFLDRDLDGVQDAGEPGIPNFFVALHDDAHFPHRGAYTDASGDYVIQSKEGSWHLHFPLPVGSAFTVQDAGSDDEADSDADPETGETDPFDIEIAALDTSRDAGLTPLLFADGFETGDTAMWE